jgi:hypothetical protein
MSVLEPGVVSAAALPWALGKRKTGVDDAPSAVEIMQELSDDMRTACDKQDSTAADRIYTRFLSQIDTDAVSTFSSVPSTAVLYLCTCFSRGFFEQ